MPRRTRKPRPARPKRPRYDPALLRMALDVAIRDAGLPEPRKEYQFARKQLKRQWRLDLSWPELRIALEIEGGIHMRGRHIRPAGFIADMEKYNRLALWGWVLIRTTYDMIADGVTIQLIEEAFAYRRAEAA